MNLRTRPGRARRAAPWLAGLAVGAAVLGVATATQASASTITATTAASTTSAASVATSAAPVPARMAAANDGAHIVSLTWIDARTLDITIDSPAMGGDEPVRLLLPPDWSARPHQKWPVLYLLNGCCNTVSYTQWYGAADQYTAGTDVLVVMPDGGPDGFFSNWWNGGAGGTPAWETFHLTELRQILLRDFRANTNRMAVAGLSMGGYGAMKYGETGLFKAAASYSGVLDPLSNPGGVFRGLYPNALWGDPVAQRDVWIANDPTDNVTKLNGVKLFVASGNGTPDPAVTTSTAIDQNELEVYHESLNFVAALKAAHVPVTANFYGDGTHSWYYWLQDFHQSYPMLMKAIGAKPASTASTTSTS